MVVRVNIGCGRTPTEGWKNLDNSPALKLAKSPLKYKLAKSLRLLNRSQTKNIEWNAENNIGFADATKKIPLSDGSADCIYTSHMVEHLSRQGASAFFAEALRVLRDGGVLRISVPDLRVAIDKYEASGDADAFMTGILVQAPPIATIKDKISLLVSGYRHHQWMYDGASLSNALASAGFSETHICKAGETRITEPAGLDLYERSEESVYVEGIK